MRRCPCHDYRPIRELWVRDTPTFTLDRGGKILAVVLLAAPADAGPGAHVLPVGDRRVDGCCRGRMAGLSVAATDQSLPVTIALLLSVQCVIGVPMSQAWRRTGNLMVPVIAHALIDAFRNALMIGL
jgi:hypothetical protein